MKVLLVDDDVDLLDVTSYALRREGFNVIAATDGVQALRRWHEEQPDVIVLDLALPRLSGFEVCRRIRESATTPIIMLTAKSDNESVLQGFRLGADDYVTKPFMAQQLAMRIRAVARRGGRNVEAEPAREIQIGNLMLDLESHELCNGHLVGRLTPIEFRLLHILAMNQGRVVGAARLVEYAWGYDAQDVSLLKTHISHIRKKLRELKEETARIEAVPGAGYRLTTGRQRGVDRGANTNGQNGRSEEARAFTPPYS